jgi:hypothetical protein
MTHHHPSVKGRLKIMLEFRRSQIVQDLARYSSIVQVDSCRSLDGDGHRSADGPLKTGLFLLFLLICVELSKQQTLIMERFVTHNLLRVIALSALAALLLAGCGGGGTSASEDATSEGAVNANSEVAEPSKEFRNPAGGRVTTFGKESEVAKREEASAVLTKSLTAREKADFAAQCETLGKRGLEGFLGKGQGNERSKCQKELKKLAEPLSKTKKIRADTLTDEIAALRVKGNQAYALYHGNDGKDYGVPMELEGGSWKVGTILPIELPQEQPKPKKPQSAAPEKKKAT